MRVVIADDSRPPARGRRPDPRGGRLRGRRPGRERRRAHAQGAQLQPGRRHRRHPHAADAHRRGPARGAARSARSIRRGVLVLSQYVEAGVRDGAPRRERRGRRLPAQGPRLGRRRVRGRRAPRGRGRLRARPDHRRRSSSAAAAATTRSPTSRRASARCSGSWPRAAPTPASRSARRHRARRREARDEHLREAAVARRARGPPPRPGRARLPPLVGVAAPADARKPHRRELGRASSCCP